MKAPKAPQVTSDINVTPMVDVMLVLLIIFMVITPMLQKDISVDLAKTQSPIEMKDADKESAIVVAITRDGTVFFGKEKTPPDQLANKVKDQLANRTNKQVFIRADSRARYGTVTDVVDNVRSAGVDEVGLLTEPRQATPPPPPPGATKKTSGD